MPEKPKTADSTNHSASAEREEALVRAIDHCGRYVLWYFNSLCQDPSLAEDLSQTLWVYVYRKFSEEEFEHIGFLKRKAHQLYIDEMRKRQVRSMVSFVEEPPEAVAAERGEPSNSAEENQLFREFWEQFASLSFSEIQKQIFWLHCRYGYTMKEVGVPTIPGSDGLVTDLKEGKKLAPKIVYGRPISRTLSVEGVEIFHCDQVHH